MNLLLAIPLESRLVAVFLLGACAGSLANLAIYRLAWGPRRISPWSRPESDAPPRKAADRVPVAGWLGLRREEELHGPWFWVRPMLLELLMGAGLAWLYWWEVEKVRLLPAAIPAALAPQTLLHVQFTCHAGLVWLMLVASMIDVDERLIPDNITVPGTLLGLCAAALYPWSLPTVIDWQLGPGAAATPHPSPLQLTSPFWAGQWPPWLRAWPSTASLGVGLACWWLWCVALMPRTWYTRHGYCRAVGLSWARLRRERATRRILLLGAAGTLAVAAVWLWAGQGAWAVPGGPWPRWTALLSALVGMVASGGLVWAVRVIGTNVLGREAMGFGDVTLMAMIGAFFGWQACLVIFLLAPFYALGIGLLRWALHAEHEIPYGPFLCLGTLTVLVRWTDVWDRVHPYFQLGWFIPGVVLACLALMGLMLWAMRAVREAFF